MNAPRIQVLRAQCDGPRDGALLRFSLGMALLDAGDAAAARTEFERATRFDPTYSAAWKLLGKACLEASDTAAAGDAWRRGIAAAEARGDEQARKEMTVFLRRLERSAD